ncbi:unnamed protein product [Rhizophagus irregularis]|nr:unnamed protein product [Rhizophagus irregularis]
MSCSKIFSGDLPELTYKVIKYFQNDLSTLHSCILVNRLCLNDDFITNKYTIINKSSHSNILFNYPRFLKYLNTIEFIFSVDKWSKLVTSTTNSKDIVTADILTDICVSLFKIFIENEVNLHTLEIEISNNYFYQTCFGIILDELILKNTNFIHNIRNLNLYNVYNYKENSNLFISFIALSLNTSFTQQIIDLTIPFKLKSLFISEISQIESFQLLLQKSGEYLENFGNVIYGDLSSNQQLLELITNIVNDITGTQCNSMILQILGQTLPSKLEYLCLNLFHIKVNDFEVFLKNSMGIGFQWKDEVNEFKLYNIEVQSYSGY